MLQKLITYNEPFWRQNAQGNLDAPSVFSYVENNSYVCLSAPHATQSFAHKKVKQSDLFTGSIVTYVAKEKIFSYIVRNKFVAQKCLINDFILENHLENHFFLDIHAMKDGNGFDLAIGTGYFLPQEYKHELEYIDALCRQFGLAYVINHENYTGRAGLTGRLQKATGKANVLQLEWRRGFRDIFTHPDAVCQITIPFICALAQEIEDHNRQINRQAI